MNTSKNKVYQIITDQFIQSLKQEKIPWSKPWISEKPVSYNKHVYTGINSLLLSLTEHKSPIWLTFNKIKSLNGNLKKDSKSQIITFWKSLIYKNNLESGETEIKNIPYLRYYKVFNFNDIENIPLPKWYVKKDKLDFIPMENAEKISNNYLTKENLDIKENGSKAYYNPTKDCIGMPTKENFFSENEYYSTLFHELNHSTGHNKRLARESFKELFSSKTEYSFEELIAEIGACFLCSEIGILNKVKNNSKAYIQSWISVLKNNPKMIINASGKAQKSVNFILN